jgi:hypothetical protein
MDAPPKLLEHCSAVFEKMKSEAKPRTVEGDHALVYEGFLTHLITQDLHLATPYYTSVMNRLKKMGCVRQLSRGGGPSPSIWELITEPTLDAFEAAEATRSKPKQDWRGQTDDVMKAMLNRIDTLEDQMATVMEELAS